MPAAPDQGRQQEKERLQQPGRNQQKGQEKALAGTLYTRSQQQQENQQHQS
jgi:hypothetical protein